MKKLFSILLILSVLLGLVACRGPAETDGTDLVETDGETEETEQGFEADGPNSNADQSFYLSGTPAPTVTLNTDATYVKKGSQSLKVVSTSAKSGVGIADVLEVFMTPRNVGKTYKITANVLPLGNNAAFRMRCPRKTPIRPQPRHITLI